MTEKSSFRGALYQEPYFNGVGLYRSPAFVMCPSFNWLWLYFNRKFDIPHCILRWSLWQYIIKVTHVDAQSDQRHLSDPWATIMCTDLEPHNNALELWATNLHHEKLHRCQYNLDTFPKDRLSIQTLRSKLHEDSLVEFPHRNNYCHYTRLLRISAWNTNNL